MKGSFWRRENVEVNDEEEDKTWKEVEGGKVGGNNNRDSRAWTRSSRVDAD